MFLKVVVPATQVLNYKSCLKVTTTREIFRHSSPDILYLLGTKMYESFFWMSYLAIQNSIFRLFDRTAN